MYKVKIFSLPGIIEQGTLRLFKCTPENIVKRMKGTKLIKAEAASGVLEEKDGRQLMYCIMGSDETREPPTK